MTPAVSQPQVITAPKLFASTAAGAGYSVTIEGESKERLTIGKAEPPREALLTDLQAFPDDHLVAFLNAKPTFPEMQMAQTAVMTAPALVHPWWPIIPQAPFIQWRPTQAGDRVDHWEFLVIDHEGRASWSEEGIGKVPQQFVWSGNDHGRTFLAVETIYTPQLLTVNRRGQRNIEWGHPVLFSSVRYTHEGQQVIELSTRRLFQLDRAEWMPEATPLLDAAGDALRAHGAPPFEVVLAESDAMLGNARGMKVIQALAERLRLRATQDFQLGGIQPVGVRGVIVTIKGSPSPPPSPLEGEGGRRPGEGAGK
ncbi:MAG: hypothetical protein HYZ73_00925 [Elusimicrobia bacterium]|nr:hypothetical protein [Elusimicrobiota bacterium]